MIMLFKHDIIDSTDKCLRPCRFIDVHNAQGYWQFASRPFFVFLAYIGYLNDLLRAFLTV